MAGILDAYLVQLGFTTDLASLRAFQQTLAMAQNTVQRSTSGILGDILKWQTGIVGAFTSLSGAIIGWGAHVANEDQQLRLYANRMMMTQQSARELKTVLDTLGVSLQDIMFDKELNDRAQRLFALQEQFKGMAPDFEKTLKDIRNLEEATTMSASQFWQYAQISIVTTLFKSFGINIEDVQAKSQKFFLELMKDMPAISTGIANVLKPIMTEAWDVAVHWGKAVAAVVDAFVKLIGVLTGDNSLKEGTLDFEKMSKAILHVANGMKIFADVVSVTVELISSLILEMDALSRWDFKTARIVAGRVWAKTKEDANLLGANDPKTVSEVVKEQSKWTSWMRGAMLPVVGAVAPWALPEWSKEWLGMVPRTGDINAAFGGRAAAATGPVAGSGAATGPAGAQDTTKVSDLTDAMKKLSDIGKELLDALGGTGEPSGASGGAMDR